MPRWCLYSTSEPELQPTQETSGEFNFPLDDLLQTTLPFTSSFSSYLTSQPYRPTVITTPVAITPSFAPFLNDHHGCLRLRCRHPHREFQRIQIREPNCLGLEIELEAHELQSHANGS